MRVDWELREMIESRSDIPQALRSDIKCGQEQTALRMLSAGPIALRFARMDLDHTPMESIQFVPNSLFLVSHCPRAI
jgi:hypothetical protein